MWKPTTQFTTLMAEFKDSALIDCNYMFNIAATVTGSITALVILLTHGRCFSKNINILKSDGDQW